MKIDCPRCGEPLVVPPESVGREIRCPGCGNVFAAENPKLFPCPDCYAMISRRAAVCPRCGAVLASPPGRPETPDLRGEEPVRLFHPSAMAYFGSIALGIATLPLGIGLFILLFVLIGIKCTSYELTTRRIIVRRGWLAKVQNEIRIVDMRGVNLEQTVWQRICGVGDVAVGTASSAEMEIRIAGVADPAAIVREINSLRRV